MILGVTWFAPVTGFLALFGLERRIGGVPVMSIFGAAGAVALSPILYFILTQPNISGMTTLGAAFILGIYLFGMVCYVARAYRRNRGLDIDLAFKEIPPE